MENQKHIEAYQDLFNYLYESCGATLLQSEMDGIIDLSLKVKEKYNKASGGEKQPDIESKCNKQSVTNRRGLLIAFYRWVCKRHNYIQFNAGVNVDIFIEESNL